jgi:hypothetical protein
VSADRRHDPLRRDDTVAELDLDFPIAPDHEVLPLVCQARSLVGRANLPRRETAARGVSVPKMDFEVCIIIIDDYDFAGRQGFILRRDRLNRSSKRYAEQQHNLHSAHALLLSSVAELLIRLRVRNLSR